MNFNPKKLLLATLFLGSGMLQAQTLPDFVMPQAQETFMRYINWKGGEETLIFPILTDIHSGWGAARNETYKHVGYMAATDRLFGYDFMACFGDIGLNGGEAHKTVEAADDLVMKTKEQMGLFPGLWIYAAGNHDWDGGGKRHNTSTYLSDVFQKPSERFAGDNLHIVEGRAYGYYDIPPAPEKTAYATNAMETSGYDHNAPCDIPDVEFARVETDRYLAGEFVWTGIDYLGEPTPYSPRYQFKKYPRGELARSSYFGACDLCAFPKDRFWLYRSYYQRRLALLCSHLRRRRCFLVTCQHHHLELGSRCRLRRNGSHRYGQAFPYQYERLSW